jgi:hypothetical protein
VCNREAKCQECGVVNAPCCPGDAVEGGIGTPVCGASLVCDAEKLCRRCGGATELCCVKDGQSACNDGFLCGKDNRCVKCGGGGEVCCADRKCAGGSCIRSGEVESCQNDCGAQGQPCCKVNDCSNGQCDGCLFGLDCDLANNQCVRP